MKRWRVTVGVILVVAGVLLGFVEPAGGQEEDWHCPYTNLETFPPGWVGEFPGSEALSQSWAVDGQYHVTQVCYRTESGLRYVDITPAQSGTILSAEPILGFSLFKVTEVPPTTTSTTSTTTPEVSTTTTTEPEETTTTTEPDEGTTTTTAPDDSTTTTDPPVTPMTAPGEVCRGTVVNGECTTPNTGSAFWPLAGAAAVMLAIGLIIAAARKRGIWPFHRVATQ